MVNIRAGAPPVSTHESQQQVGMPSGGQTAGMVSETSQSVSGRGGWSASVVAKDVVWSGMAAELSPGVAGQSGAAVECSPDMAAWSGKAQWFGVAQNLGTAVAQSSVAASPVLSSYVPSVLSLLHVLVHSTCSIPTAISAFLLALNCFSKSKTSLQGFITFMAALLPMEAASITNLAVLFQVFISTAPSVLSKPWFLGHASNANKACLSYFTPYSCKRRVHTLTSVFFSAETHPPMSPNSVLLFTWV